MREGEEDVEEGKDHCASFSSQGLLVRVLFARNSKFTATVGYPMTSATKWKAAVATLFAALTCQGSAFGEVPFAHAGGWTLTTDGRVGTFISVDQGNGIPENQPDYIGTVTRDRTHDTAGNIQATRIRNGFLASILGFEASYQVSDNLKVTARVELWLSVSAGRTIASQTPVDPRRVYAKLEGSWGSLLGGRELALFGRGGMWIDYDIAHGYGLGYPCQIEDASGGACGMAGFGGIYPGDDAGLVYTTPKLGGIDLSVGVYDPAVAALGQLNRAPWPRVEAEARYAFKDIFRVFVSGFYEHLEGTIPSPTPDPATMLRPLVDINANAQGVQGGLMVTLGPVMVGGAVFTGQALSPITYLDENQASFNPTHGTPRHSYGGFGLAAVTLDSLHLKLAGGAGLFHLDKTPDDPQAIDPVTGAPGNPQLLKQNIGYTLGLYQTTGPLHFALEYFRAEHTLYDYGQVDPTNPNLIDVITPRQKVNFVNAGFTVVW